MIEEAEALERILAALPPSGHEAIPLAESTGRYCAQDVHATIDLPGFDNSAMDGYAVRAVDAGAGERLSVVAEVAAGRSPEGAVVGPGEAVRIFTGAPLPAGADSVVMQEDVLWEPATKSITINAAAEKGEFVRQKGGDVCRGQVLVEAGARLSPQRIGLLASQGVREVAAGKRPRVAVVSTGDELVDAGVPLGPGQIYNSNAAMLVALLENEGIRDVVRLHAPDDPDTCVRIMRDARDVADLVVVSGGVSVGEHDHVRSSLGEVGFETGFWRVRIKPGKPFLFGRHRDGQKLAFGLPGNPVSSFVTFVVLVLPALRAWSGAGVTERALRRIPIELAEGIDLTNRGDRPEYTRGWIDPVQGRFRPVGIQQSHALFGLSRTDALVRVDAGVTLPAGTRVPALVL